MNGHGSRRWWNTVGISVSVLAAVATAAAVMMAGCGGSPTGGASCTSLALEAAALAQQAQSDPDRVERGDAFLDRLTYNRFGRLIVPPKTGDGADDFDGFTPRAGGAGSPAGRGPRHPGL